MQPVSLKTKAKQQSQAPELFTATIMEVQPTCWRVADGTDHFTATRAASCLLRPQIDDQVLCVKISADCSLIIAILEQANTTQQQYDFSPDITCKTAVGTLAFSAHEITLNSLYKTEFNATALNVNAERATLKFTYLNYSGQEQIQRVQTVKNEYQFIEQHAEYQHLYAKQMVECVQDLKHQMLGDLHTLVKNDYRIESERVTIFADDTAQIDAKQINMN